MFATKENVLNFFYLENKFFKKILNDYLNGNTKKSFTSIILRLLIMFALPSNTPHLHPNHPSTPTLWKIYKKKQIYNIELKTQNKVKIIK